MSFYMFLPSNVSPRYFPGNRISSFKVKLPKRITFQQHDFKVALTEATYTRAIRTLLSHDARRFELRTSEDPLINHNDLFKTFVFPVLHIPDSNYGNIFTMVDNLNNTIAMARDPYSNSCTFVYDVMIDRISIILEDTYEVILSPEFV